MKPTLVDTDVLSAFLRGNVRATVQATQYLREHESLNISIITYYEMLNGLLYKDARKQLQSFLDFAELNSILPLTLDATRTAAEIFAQLRKTGQPIGHTDCLIAGITITNGMTLATNNENHFRRIDRLEITNWLV